MPTHANWWQGGQTFQLRRKLDRLVQEGQDVHVVVQLSNDQEQVKNCLSGMKSLLQWVAQSRDQLIPRTLQEIASELRDRHRVRSSKSVLRAA